MRRQRFRKGYRRKSDHQMGERQSICFKKVCTDGHQGVKFHMQEEDSEGEEEGQRRKQGVSSVIYTRTLSKEKTFE